MTAKDTPDCSEHPNAPHGFDRKRSRSYNRYTCTCEGWEPHCCPRCGKELTSSFVEISIHKCTPKVLKNKKEINDKE